MLRGPFSPGLTLPAVRPDNHDHVAAILLGLGLDEAEFLDVARKALQQPESELGLRRFSVAPGQMLEVKSAIRRARIDDAEHCAREALELGTAHEIEALIARAQPETF